MVGYYIVAAIGLVFTVGVVCIIIDMISPRQSQIEYILHKNSVPSTIRTKDPLIKDDFDMDEDEFYKNID